MVALPVAVLEEGLPGALEQMMAGLLVAVPAAVPSEGPAEAREAGPPVVVLGEGLPEGPAVDPLEVAQEVVLLEDQDPLVSVRTVLLWLDKRAEAGLPEAAPGEDQPEV